MNVIFLAIFRDEATRELIDTRVHDLKELMILVEEPLDCLYFRFEIVQANCHLEHSKKNLSFSSSMRIEPENVQLFFSQSLSLDNEWWLAFGRLSGTLGGFSEASRTTFRFSRTIYSDFKRIFQRRMFCTQKKSELFVVRYVRRSDESFVRIVRMTGISKTYPNSVRTSTEKRSSTCSTK